MKVLVVHNRYRSDSPSGETKTVDEEIARLTSAGVTVEPFFRSSDEIDSFGLRDRALLPLAPITGGPSRKSFAVALKSFRPDLVHLHNPYPLISPSIIRESRALGVPVVVTVQNFRLQCVNGQFFRSGQICTDCEHHSVPWPALVHGCYRGSRLETLPMATALVKHRRVWSEVCRFIAVSRFVADRLGSWGLPPGRVKVKPNASDDPGEHSEVGDGFLYAGRLSAEKGVGLLLDAWESSDLGSRSHLLIAGDGPLRAQVESRARTLSNVEVLGPQTAAALVQLRRATAVSVVPSIWFEAHPLTIVESFANARPVVSTNCGSLAEAVDDEVGWSVEPYPDAFAAALQDAARGVGAPTRGVAARARYMAQYSPEVVTRQLISIYEDTLAK